MGEESFSTLTPDTSGTGTLSGKRAGLRKLDIVKAFP